jgi:hypothetical protein
VPPVPLVHLEPADGPEPDGTPAPAPEGAPGPLPGFVKLVGVNGDGAGGCQGEFENGGGWIGPGSQGGPTFGGSGAGTFPELALPGLGAVGSCPSGAFAEVSAPNIRDPPRYGMAEPALFESNGPGGDV